MSIISVAGIHPGSPKANELRKELPHQIKNGNVSPENCFQAIALASKNNPQRAKEIFEEADRNQIWGQKNTSRRRSESDLTNRALSKMCLTGQEDFTESYENRIDAIAADFLGDFSLNGNGMKARKPRHRSLNNIFT